MNIQNTTMKMKIPVFLALALAFCVQPSFATLCSRFPDTQFRKTVSLNGVWDFQPRNGTWTTIDVPDCWQGKEGFDNAKSAVYKTTFDVPSGFTGRIMLEFEAVNDMCTLSVNGNPVGTHGSKDVFFAFDISDEAQAGDTGIALALNVSVGDEFHVQGWHTDGERNLGIRGDVYLTCCPDVYISDCSIHTSYRHNQVTFQYRIVNTTDTGRTITITPEAKDADDNLTLKAFEPLAGIVLAAGETKTVSMTRDWADPDYWSPATPENRYVLNSRLTMDGSTVDVQKEKFGFREFYRIGNRFYLNGVAMNLRGESVVDHGCRIQNVTYADCADPQQDSWYAYFFDKVKMGMLVDRIRALNLNALRTHMGPACDEFYEVCDEKGMMVVCEAPMYERPNTSGAELDSNTVTYIREFVASYKNHPSIVIWSGANEGVTCWNYALMESTYKSVDISSRPVVFHRDGESTDAKISHYSTSHNSPKVIDNLYGAAGPTDKVKGEGEFFWVYNYSLYNPDAPVGAWKRKLYGQGIMTRAYRYAGYGYIFPYRMNWAWKWTIDDTSWAAEVGNQIDLLKKSMSAVAVYDKAGDGQWTDCLAPRKPGNLGRNTAANRVLLVYNDEYYGGEDVTVNWWLQGDGTVHDSGSVTVPVPYGSCREETVAVTAPDTCCACTLVLEAQKGGVRTYYDDCTYAFLVRDVTGIVDDNNTGTIQYSAGWNADSDILYYNATKHTSNTAGATATLDFTGTYVAVYCKTAGTLGSFNVTIDGVICDSVSTRSDYAEYEAKVFEKAGLADSAHTIRITVTGDGWVGLDYIALNGESVIVNEDAGIVDDDSTDMIQYSTGWNDESDALYYNGTKHASNTAGATATLDFSGTYVAVYCKTAGTLGSFDVAIDGMSLGNVTTGSDSTAYRVKVFETSGLTDSSHTLLLTVTGDGWVGLDYFLVRSDSTVTAVGPSLPEPVSGTAIRVIGRCSRISFDVPQEYGNTRLTLAVYDTRGRLIRTLLDDVVRTGQRVIRWNGTSSDGSRSRQGVKIIRLLSNGRTLGMKLLMDI